MTKISRTPSPAIIRVMMMQKNEGPRLARWLTHYAGLFGMESLIIFDNGSDDAYTHALLDEAERCGALVRRDLTAPSDFRNKGGHFTNVIRALNNECEYDFALPVDCDELLCVFTDDGLSLAREDVMAEFCRLKPFDCPFSLELSLFNLPGVEQEGWYAPNRVFPKGFVPAYCDAMIDNGHHAPSASHTTERQPTRFTYLHSHNRPYQEMIRRCQEKLKLELDHPDDVSNPDKIREYLQRPHCPGSHLGYMLLRRREEYEASYQGDVQIYFRGGLVLIRTSEGRLHVWNPHNYLARNPDTKAYLAGPLAHYLMHGIPEGRSLG